MEKQPELIFPHPDIPIEECDGGLTVCHPQRGIRLKITPEERVRRHVAGWLRDLRIEPQRIVEEYPVRLNGQPQRADVVVVDRQGRPRLLVECKAPGVKLSQKSLDQVVRYNSVLGAEFILLTNGLECYLYRHLKAGAYRPATPPELTRDINREI
ncbi:MAG: type I restriction enzyme HsdR N-terminal domain-containing protein [Rikenellaceae bacterium]|nr:type I restriction enzyme HsdR N-terminal domain-containing protein [Rikenellaceae bacterium]